MRMLPRKTAVMALGKKKMGKLASRLSSQKVGAYCNAGQALSRVVSHRLEDIAEICRTCRHDESATYSSDSVNIVYEIASQIQKKVDQIVLECSKIEAVGDEDLEACLAHLETEIKMVEEENTKLSAEVEVLTQSVSEDLTCLETELERLTYSIDHISSQGLERGAVGHGNPSEGCSLRAPLYDTEFEMMELSDQIEKNDKVLQSLKDLDVQYRRFEAVESIEDTLTGVKVLGYENNLIRFAVRTYVPRLGGSFSKPAINDISDSSALDHELSIRLVDGTLEPDNLEVIPNDVHFDKILAAAKYMSHAKSLEWLVRKVQDKIVICSLRRNFVKAAKNSRHSFEYNDDEETIISHMVGEFDAYIKVPIGWPIIDSPLNLISLRSPDQKRISLAFLCKVQESANSLDALLRQNLQSFVEAMEEILVQQMSAELHQ